MAFTQSQLDSVEEALLSGATSVSYEGKTVQYRSLDELLRLRDLIRRALGLIGAPATVLIAHSKGIQEFSNDG